MSDAKRSHSQLQLFNPCGLLEKISYRRLCCLASVDGLLADAERSGDGRGAEGFEHQSAPFGRLALVPHRHNDVGRRMKDALYLCRESLERGFFSAWQAYRSYTPRTPAILCARHRSAVSW